MYRQDGNRGLLSAKSRRHDDESQTRTATQCESLHARHRGPVGERQSPNPVQLQKRSHRSSGAMRGIFVRYSGSSVTAPPRVAS